MTDVAPNNSCMGMTKKGERCSRTVTGGHTYCHQHIVQDTTAGVIEQEEEEDDVFNTPESSRQASVEPLESLGAQDVNPCASISSADIRDMAESLVGELITKVEHSVFPQNPVVVDEDNCTRDELAAIIKRCREELASLQSEHVALKVSYATNMSSKTTALKMEKSLVLYLQGLSGTTDKTITKFKEKYAKKMRTATKRAAKRLRKQDSIIDVPKAVGNKIISLDIGKPRPPKMTIITKPLPDNAMDEDTEGWTKVNNVRFKKTYRQAAPVPRAPVKYKKLHVEWIRPKNNGMSTRRDDIIEAKKMITDRLHLNHKIRELSFVGKAILELYFEEQDETAVREACTNCSELLIVHFQPMINRFGRNGCEIMDGQIAARLGFLIARNMKFKALKGSILEGYSESIKKKAITKGMALSSQWSNVRSAAQW